MRLSALAAGSPGAGATLRVSAARASAGSIRFFDPSGRLVRHLAVGFATGGEQLVYWDGRSDENRRCPPGLYFARASAAGETASARVRLR
jgi:hypothetical protein